MKSLIIYKARNGNIFSLCLVVRDTYGHKIRVGILNWVYVFIWDFVFTLFMFFPLIGRFWNFLFLDMSSLAEFFY